MRPTEHRSLHYDLSHLDDMEREYTFRHGKHRMPLQRHTATTIAEARAALPLLRLIPDRHLTHFVDAQLYTDAIGINAVSVKKHVNGKPIDKVVHMAVHIPAKGWEHGRLRWLRHQEELARKRGVEPPKTVHPKLARFGVTYEQAEAVLGGGSDNIPTFPAHVYNFNTALDAAVTMIYHHQNLINLDVTDGGSNPAYLQQAISQACTATDDLVLEIEKEKDNWMVVTDQGNYEPSAPVQALSTGPVSVVLADTQNDTELADVCWRPQYGVTSSNYNSTNNGPTAPLPAHADTLLRGGVELTGGDGAGNWSAKNLTPVNGLSVNTDSIQYSPPPTTTTWTGTGLWSINDTPPLAYAGMDGQPNDLPTRIADGQISIVVSSAAYPNGFLSGVLVPNGTDPDTVQTLYAVTLAPVAGVTTTATGTASCALNAGVSGLTYSITVQLNQEKGPIAAGFVYPDPAGGKTPGTAPISMSDATGFGSISIECTNNWLRHLSCHVQWVGNDGNLLPAPSCWNDQIPAWLRDPFEQDPQTPYVQLVGPVTTIFGVAIPNRPERITVPVWDEVATVRLKWGGLGSGQYDTAVCPIGLTMTLMAEIALPVFLMWATAAIMDSSVVKSIIADKDVLIATCAVAASLAAGAVALDIGTAQNPGDAAKELAERFGPLFLNPLTSLGKWVIGQELEAEAENSIPFIDLALKVLDVAVTTAQLASTTIECIQSPFVYETELTRSVELDVILTPDPATGGNFPDQHDHYTVTVTYDTGATAATVTNYLPANTPTLSDPITVTFEAIPSGGDIKVVVAFFSKDNWQSGQGNSDWIDTVVEKGQLAFPVTVFVNTPPLDASSVYYHFEKIALLTDGSNQLGWVGTAAPPTSTITTPPPYQSKGMAVQYLAGITVAQAPSALGYCWQATGLNLPPNTPDQKPQNYAMWALQNLSVQQHPSQGLSFPKVGYTGQPLIAYDLATSSDGKGPNFFLDPSRGTFDPVSNPAGGLHLRKLALTPGGAPTFTTGSNQSYGRFPIPMDRCMLHPQGFLVGVNNATHKIFILNVLDDAHVATDDAAPMATQAAGQGDRDGLIDTPVGICTALDGRVLVLESVNRRVQAFDTYGKPVNYFDNPDYDPNDANSTQTIPTMPIVKRDQTTLLDLAVESKGYIYILSYVGTGADPKQYYVDLFNPDGTLLVTTQGVTAARFTVDLLRALYTLNYETIVDANYRVQPSISKWLPPTPVVSS